MNNMSYKSNNTEIIKKKINKIELQNAKSPCFPSPDHGIGRCGKIIIFYYRIIIFYLYYIYYYIYTQGNQTKQTTFGKHLNLSSV